MGEGAVNLDTGKIVGAEEGSLSWWHEDGHKVYNDSDKGIKNGLKKQWIFDFFLCSLIFTSIWWYFAFLSGVLFVIYKGFDLYEERWCWKYARKKWYGKTRIVK